MHFKQEHTIDMDSYFIGIFIISYRKSSVSICKENITYILLQQGKRSQYDDSLDMLFLFIFL